MYFLLLFPSISKSQGFVFTDHDRICFIGASITMNGGCFHFINLFYSTRYPERDLHFFNGGISGEVTDQILSRMDADILSNKPTHCVMMIEENDLRPALYYPEKQGDSNIKKQQSEAFHHWTSNVELIAQTLMQHKIKVILQTPTVYDQTVQSPAANAFGINDTLQRCAAYLKTLGKKYNLPVVDCWTMMNRINRNVQRIDPKASIIGPDRMHAAGQGHFEMARTFLSAQQVQPFVSRFQVDFKTGKAGIQENCTLSNIQKTDHSLSFQYYSHSLPFAAPEDINPDSFSNFTDEMNADIIKVRHLAKGKYLLSIDTVLIDSFTNEQLEKGINLSYHQQSPQFRQAVKVMNLFKEYWKNERLLRSLKYVEYQHRHDLQKAENVEQLNARLPDIMQKYKEDNSPNYDFFYQMFRNYIANKPQEDAFIKKAEDILQKISSCRQPAHHQYVIKKVS